MPEQSHHHGAGKNAEDLRALPDPAICRTRPIGEIQSFATCLVECPITCRYVMGYGNGYLCKHPNWKDFIPTDAK